MVEIKEAKNQTDIMGMTPCGRGKLLKVDGKVIEVQGKPYSGHIGLTVAVYVSLEGYKTRIIYDGERIRVYKYRSIEDTTPFWDKLLSLTEAMSNPVYSKYVLYLSSIYDDVKSAS